MFKLVSLGFSLFVFILTTTWTTPEIFNLLISVLFSLYCIWCIWSLHEALMLGGEAAAKAGFTAEEVVAVAIFVREQHLLTRFLTGRREFPALQF
jgi:hypothetical protein